MERQGSFMDGAGQKQKSARPVAGRAPSSPSRTTWARTVTDRRGTAAAQIKGGLNKAGNRRNAGAERGRFTDTSEPERSLNKRIKPHTATGRFISTPGRNRTGSGLGGYSRTGRRKSSIYFDPEDGKNVLERSHTDYETPRRPATVTPWMAFSQEIRQIDDSTALIAFASHGNNMDKGASPQYLSIIEELRIRRQQQIEAMKAKAESERLASVAFTDFSDDESNAGEDENAKMSPARVTALRAWAIIRRNVHEVAMEKRNNGAALNWSFLNQTIKRMTNMEKGRQDLYDKYLKKPDEWKDGIVNKHLLKAIERRTTKKDSKDNRSTSSSPAFKTPRREKANMTTRIR